MTRYTTTGAPAVVPTVVVIDSDEAAGLQLRSLLLDRFEQPDIVACSSVAAATKMLLTTQIHWLFIRINQWDDYQQVTYHNKHQTEQRARCPDLPRIVFLSGRAEKRTDHLGEVLDAHLQAPYRATRLTKIIRTVFSPDFTPRPLDIFFLKHQARSIPIRYPDLYQVQTLGRELWIETRRAEYRITGTLSAFACRLPIPLARVRRGWLVNELYEQKIDHVAHI